MIRLLDRLIAPVEFHKSIPFWLYVRAQKFARETGAVCAVFEQPAERQPPLRRLAVSCTGDIVGRSRADPSNPASMPSMTPMAMS